MRRILRIFSKFWNKSSASKDTSEIPAPEQYRIFDKDNHLRPLLDKEKFDALHSWELGWAIVEPINIASSREDEMQLSKRLSPGQKAIYFIWYLDAQVTNGGFIQFYWNGYGRYLSPIKDGLKLIGEDSILDLVEKADKEFNANIRLFITQRKKDEMGPLYENLKAFDEYDTTYYETHDSMMDRIENYIRLNPHEFVRFE